MYNPLTLLTRDPNPNDFFYKTLNYATQYDVSTGNGGNQIVLDMLSVWCYILFYITLVFLAFNVGSRLISAAGNGDAGGGHDKQWKWLAIGPWKSFFGIMSLIPLPGGAGIIQLVLIASTIGSYGGNDATEIVIERAILNGEPVMVSATYGRELTWQIIESEVCMAVHNGLNDYVSRPYGLNPPQVTLNESKIERLLRPDAIHPQSATDLGSNILKKLGNANLTGIYTKNFWVWGSNGECGGIQFEDDGDEHYTAARNAAVTVFIDNIRNDVAEYFLVPEFFQGGYNFSKDTSKGDPTHIHYMISAGRIPAAFSAYVNSAALEYNKLITEAAIVHSGGKAEESRQNAAAFMRDKGFISLPLADNMVSATSSAVATMTSARPERLPLNISDAYLEKYNQAMNLLRAAEKIDPVEINVSDFAAVGNAGDDAWKITSAVAGLSQEISSLFTTTIVDNFLGGKSVDPRAANQALGHVMLDFWWGKKIYEWTTEAGIWGAVKYVGQGIVNSIPIAGGATTALSEMTGWFMTPMLAIGTAYAYILPMVPVIFYILGVFVLFMYIMEAMVSMPLVAAIMVQLDAQEIISDRDRPGLHYMINIMARPIIMTLIYILNMVFVPALLLLFNEMWPYAFYGNQGGSVVGAIGVMVSIMMHCFITTQIYLRFYSLILTAPNRILQLVGVNAPDMGESGLDAAVGGGAVALASRMGGSGGGGGGSEGGGSNEIADAVKKGSPDGGGSGGMAPPKATVPTPGGASAGTGAASTGAGAATSGAGAAGSSAAAGGAASGAAGAAGAGAAGSAAGGAAAGAVGGPVGMAVGAAAAGAAAKKMKGS